MINIFMVILKLGEDGVGEIIGDMNQELLTTFKQNTAHHIVLPAFWQHDPAP